MSWKNLISEKKYEEAKAVMEEELQDAPDDDIVLEHLGVVHFIQNDLEKAEAYFMRAFEKKGTLDRLYNIVKTKYKLNKFTEVIYLADAFLKIDDQDGDILEMLADSYFHAQDYPKAIETLERASAVKEKISWGETAQSEKDRLDEWANEFYSKISMFGEEKRKRSKRSFHFLFKDHVMEYKILEKLQKYGLGLNEARILDAGCGDGRWLRKFVDWGASPEQLVGIDINEPILDLAKTLSAPGIQYEKAYSDDLSFADGEFDIILLFGVMQHIMESGLRRKTAQELMRVLSDNGMLITYNININVEQWMTDYLSKTTKGMGREELSEIFAGCSIELEEILLDDAEITHRVTKEWGTLFDRAIQPDLPGHYYSFAVVRKK